MLIERFSANTTQTYGLPQWRQQVAAFKLEEVKGAVSQTTASPTVPKRFGKHAFNELSEQGHYKDKQANIRVY